MWRPPLQLPPLLFPLLLLLLPEATHGCPEPCSCSGTAVNCEALGLTQFPTKIPADATSVLLHDNAIRSVPRGALDYLPNLRLLTLHGNPLRCGCDIAYLHTWLHQNLRSEAEEGVKARLQARCVAPTHLCGRRVALLTSEEVRAECEARSGCFWMSVSQAGLSLLALAHLSLAFLVAVYSFAGRACAGSPCDGGKEGQEGEDEQYEDIAHALAVHYDFIDRDARLGR